MSAGKRVAITGGTGFVGRAVLDAAERNRCLIRSLARNIPDGEWETTEWVQGSLENECALAELATDADAIIHIAGLTNTPDPAQFTSANVDGTANVIAAAKSAGVRRFVFVSSLSARKPELSQYGASKLAAEKLVEASGLDWTIVRPPGVYGPRDVDYFDMFRSARFGFVPLPPGGASSLIHVDDLAALLLALVPSGPKVRRKLFEPDDGREGGWSHKELAVAIGKAVGRKVLAPHLPASVLNAAAAIDRIARGDKAKLTPDRVGYMCHPNWVSRSDRTVPTDIWQPQISGDDGLRATAQWYRDEGWF